ncbi:MAG: DUF3150 domain-containing protein [Desulfuromonadaceae bacterium]
MSKINILENIAVFILDIHLWSGRKKLRAEDLAVNGIEVDKLPPGTLASLGSKKIISSDALAPFAALKREAEKICLAKGVRFLGGYAVPVGEAQELHNQLAILKRRFEKARAELLQDYDMKVQEWIKDNPPEWAAVIRASVDPARRVQQALAFDYTPIKVDATQEISTDSESNPLQSQTEGLYAQLCREVRGMATTAYSASYEGKSSVTRKALRPISAIREKLSALEFLSPDISTLISAIDQTLDNIPPNGPIQGYRLDTLNRLLRELSHLGEPHQEHQGRDVRHAQPHTRMHGGGRDTVPEKKQEQGQSGSAEDAHSEDALQQAKPHGTVALAWDF